MPEIKTRSNVKKKERKKRQIKAKSVVKRRDFNQTKMDHKEKAYHKMLQIAQQINKHQKQLKKKDKQKKEDMLQQVRRERNRKKQPKLAEKAQARSIQRKSKTNGKNQRGFVKFTTGKKKKYLERGKLKYFLGKGNNFPLMTKLIEKRKWWESVNQSEAGELTRKRFGPGQFCLGAHD